jgi:hypothetical protein
MSSTPKRKRIAILGDLEIWDVDGPEIRRDHEIEFTNFAHHYRFPKLVPEAEIWLDHEANRNETMFFLAHCIVEREEMRRGKGYSAAHRVANEIERVIRRKAGDSENQEIPKRLLATTHDGTKIYRVGGREVRSSVDIDFTEGGHGKVYKYIPDDEVWVDDDLVEEDIPFVLLHELLERKNMEKGMEYDEAHKISSKLELAARKNPEMLPALLKIVFPT